jgi:hypothetical protein
VLHPEALLDRRGQLGRQSFFQLGPHGGEESTLERMGTLGMI